MFRARGISFFFLLLMCVCDENRLSNLSVSFHSRLVIDNVKECRIQVWKIFQHIFYSLMMFYIFSKKKKKNSCVRHRSLHRISHCVCVCYFIIWFYPSFLMCLLTFSSLARFVNVMTEIWGSFFHFVWQLLCIRYECINFSLSGLFNGFIS